MRWVAKAALQKALSASPHPDRANELFQRHVARSLPVSDDAFRRKASAAVRHFRAFLEHGAKPPEEAVFYEFGAGWDLAIPLVYHALGVEEQVLVDIRPNVRFDLVADSLAKLERHREDLAEEAGRELRGHAEPPKTLAELEERFGIRYLAPRDARDTGLPAGSVDFVSSTDTLEHIPEADIARILRECRRLVRPDGLFSSRIDLRDHYAYFDRSLSVYNFLRFSDRAWSLVNSAVHYQNRLRVPDHLRLLREAGFEVVEARVAEPSDADLRTLDELPLARRFQPYPRDALGGKSLAVVCKPAV